MGGTIFKLHLVTDEESKLSMLALGKPVRLQESDNDVGSIPTVMQFKYGNLTERLCTCLLSSSMWVRLPQFPPNY